MRTNAEPLARPGSFSHTVARELVHRWALSEVFISGFSATGPRGFVADAQLPLYHAYFTDHAMRPESFDPLLLLECVRQGGTLGTHEMLGLPMTATLLIRALSIEITDPGGLVLGTRPGELRISGVYTLVQMRGGGPRNLEMVADLVIDERAVASVRMAAGAADKPMFRNLRLRQRGSQPPLSSSLPATPAGVASSPHLYGRALPENVVLTNAVRDEGSTRAQLGVHPRNRALFDHEYDHYPAMSLLEAARQLALLALDDGSGTAAARVRWTHFGAEFSRFAELDAPVEVVLAGHRSGELDVHFVQHGAVIAETTVGYGSVAAFGAAA